MAIAEPVSGNKEGYRTFIFGKIEDRIAAHCAWFDIEPPELEYDDDEPDAVFLTDDLLNWARRSGGSIDWLLFGDPKGMAVAFEEKHRHLNEILENFRALDEEAKDFVMRTLRAGNSGEISTEQMFERMEAFKAARGVA